ncbi:MAG TPA: amidohydrolase family protein, partial [Chryseosolibacter sp.]|nr:amidohydrolase family protein [Chryseosolibacter sp.]
EIDAKGMAVAPGFINMLSWADQTILRDGRSTSDIKQGVTFEVFGEGWSPGPVRRQTTKPVDSLWTTLDGYFRFALKKGISCNIASFVGATSVRIHEMNYSARKPTPQEMERMKRLVKEAMEQGAMGLGTSLIYAPANYASTEELIELARVASSYGGMYITHMRSESDQIIEGLNETFRIAREANIAAEIYHLKINNSRNWNKIDTVLSLIDQARAEGLKITANMYPYIASGTGLSARLPIWVQEGGARQMRKRLADPAIRKKVLYEMQSGIPQKNSDPENVVLTGFRLDSLNRIYKGKRLSQVSLMHGKNADETVIDLVVRDKSRIEAIYYLQSEDNVRKIVRLPYVSFGSDAGSYTLSPDSTLLSDHPRAFGTFARVLGKYVRDEKLITLPDAIRRLTQLPASNLKLKKRGNLKPGFYADIVIFDPAAVRDKATFEKPHVYSEGVIDVFVNGIQVLENGIHTGAKPGRVIRGPGYKRK